MKRYGEVYGYRDELENRKEAWIGELNNGEYFSRDEVLDELMYGNVKKEVMLAMGFTEDEIEAWG